MEKANLKKLLEAVQRRDMSVETAMDELKNLPFKNLEFARPDTHRTIRCGFPEVIYCEGKRAEHIGKIALELLKVNKKLLATRADLKAFKSIKKVAYKLGLRCDYEKLARCVVVSKPKQNELKGAVAVISAGTSDIPIAEEARVTAEMMNCKTKTICDVGVAGLHRLLGSYEEFNKARVIVVVAGMEGALPSVVKGLVEAPVIAVPTSVGYGGSFGGVAPLLTMLNTCSPGIAVVNINNGFGAGYLAGLINNLSKR